MMSVEVLSTHSHMHQLNTHRTLVLNADMQPLSWMPLSTWSWQEAMTAVLQDRALGAIAVSTKHELVLAIVGGLFVVEALSVIIQVLYFKRTGKRVFLMAPIHHHYEKKGWAEPQIVIRFWIISLILAMIGLATLKVR